MRTLFGMGVPGFLPISYTAVSYRDFIRIGLITNSGSIEDPEVLMKCFVVEWNEIGANVDGANQMNEYLKV